jgi:hypothetical protein
MKSIKEETVEWIRYKNEFGRYHREDGPSIEWISGYAKGVKYYHYDGKLHRLDGPAISGNSIPLNEEWWIMNKRHRVRGAAHFSIDEKSWYKNNMYHRLNAPAKFIDSSYKGDFTSDQASKFYYEFGRNIKLND